ncbi:MAG: thiamine pyrophosphate-dependent enzyme, partial [Pseudomonadales bacterium]
GQTETRHYGKGKGVLHEAELQLPMLRNVTRITESPRRTRDVPEALARVIRNIMTGRPQPGAIEIPVDLQYESVDLEIASLIEGERIEPDASAIKTAVKRLGETGKRFIIAGGGVIRSGASDELVKLAEALDAPVFTTTNGRGAIPEDHSLAGGTFLMACREAIADADLVLAVGTRFQGGSTGNFSLQMPGSLIHIDADPHMVGLNYSPEVAVLGDAKLSLTAILDSINAVAGDAAFKTRVLAAAGTARKGVRERMGPDFELIMDTIRDRLPVEGHIVRDATVPAYVWGNTLIPILKPQTSHHTTSAAIGPGLPLAIGAALGTGEKAVVIQGDGGFMLNLSELATAVQFKVPVIVCLFNDGGYGVLRRIQGARFEGRTTGVDLATPDFVKVAEGIGLKGIAVDSAEAFADAFDTAMATDGPVLLDINMNHLQPMRMGIG